MLGFHYWCLSRLDGCAMPVGLAAQGEGLVMAWNRSRVLSAFAGFGCGILVARMATEPANSVFADEKKPPEAFLSGGARSEKVLIEMLATLKQLDGRVAGIEELLKHSESTRPPVKALPKASKDDKP